jgi:uncharacterized protein (TIGR04255 family)
MGEKMQHAPIFFTIGQIRFNPFLDMQLHVEALQTEFRKYSFSGFSEENLTTIQLDPSGASPNVVPTSQKRWRFTNSKRTGEFVLFQNSISYQTTNYETSQDFKSRLMTAIKIVHKELNLDYVEQIGFRTLDAIIPTPDHPLETWLKPSLIGFYSSTGDNLKHSILEGVSTIGPSGFLVQRVVILHGALAIPLDLMPITLTIDARFTSINDWHAILDTDFTAREQFDFDLDTISERITTVKKEASNAFRSAVTKSALDLWR